MSWVAAAVLGSAVIGGGISLFGAKTAADANKEAAKTGTEGQLEAAKLQTQAYREAQDKQLAFAREGQARLEQGIAAEQPGVDYLRRVVADPGSLTPQQAAALEEARRATRNQISTSSIAGSGRTAHSLLRKVESDFTNDALEKNRRRADDAATGMASRAGGYTTGIGNISVGTGTQQAALSGKIGEAQGGAASNIGTLNANATTATGKLYGETLGNIGGTIASEMRRSRYADTYGSPSAGDMIVQSLA